MAIKNQDQFTARVINAAEAALEDHQYVTPIDLLANMQLVAWSNVDAWKKGRLETLEPEIQGGHDKLSYAFSTLVSWANAKGLKENEIPYTRSTREGVKELQVTINGDPTLEKFFRTHFLSAALPERKQQKLVEKQSKPADPVVFEILRDSQCTECGAELWKDSFLFMDGGQPLCLPCANLGDLEYLPAGDAALTRRATKYSARKAVVVRFSRSRGHYERQGILVEPAAIGKAEKECLDDSGDRAKARAAGAIKRKKEDAALTVQMVDRISELFSGCPEKEVEAIAHHTAVPGSGRVGRTAAGKALDSGALTAAVTAAVRHNHTDYDSLLASGIERSDAREQASHRVQSILAAWRE